MINRAKLRVFKNLSAAQVAVLICHSHPALTEQRVFGLGGELWEVPSLHAADWASVSGSCRFSDCAWDLTSRGSLDFIFEPCSSPFLKLAALDLKAFNAS